MNEIKVFGSKTKHNRTIGNLLETITVSDGYDGYGLNIFSNPAIKKTLNIVNKHSNIEKQQDVAEDVYYDVSFALTGMSTNVSKPKWTCFIMACRMAETCGKRNFSSTNHVSQKNLLMDFFSQSQFYRAGEIIQNQYLAQICLLKTSYR